MKNKKIIILFILVLLISIFGVSFALYNYNKTSKNSKLIVGDIYMHYKESDMSILTTAEDTSNFYYEKDILNPNMKNQEYQEKQVGEDTRNELSKCVDYFDELNISYDDGTTGITYCQGTGTAYGGYSFQQDIDDSQLSEEKLTNLKNLNVISSKKGILSSYSTDKATPNPEMKNQTYETDNRNELSKCVDYFREYFNNKSSGPAMSYVPNNKSNVFQITTGILKIDNLSSVDDATIIAYCQGTGAIYNNNTFQNDIDNSKFNSSMLNELKYKNIVTSDNEVNPIMASQTYTENGQNELSKCVDYFVVKIESVPHMSNNLNKYLVKQIDTSNTELTTRMINFCQGTGTFTGTEDSFNIQTAINDNYFSSDTYLYNNNIIVYETKTLPYFEFIIDGKNTSNKNINYNIKLAHGDVIENKTENNRLMDKYLIFKLVEVINNEEVELVDNIKYDNINNNIIYKNIISKNTNEEINHTYRLYMIVDPNLMIGNLEGAVYSFEEYANLFASIKVNVDGNYE